VSTDTEAIILQSIRELNTKVDDIREHHYESGLKTIELEGRVKATENYIKEHKGLHEDEIKHRRALNWKMWIVIISAVIGLIFTVAKDSFF
jgi:hypothetical protein